MALSPELEIRPEPLSDLALQAEIPIAFRVERVLDVSPAGREGYTLHEHRLDHGYVKDYDALPGNTPLDWRRRFDLRHWGLLGAWHDGRRVGGAALALSTAELSEQVRPGIAPQSGAAGDGEALPRLGPGIAPQSRAAGDGEALPRLDTAWLWDLRVRPEWRGRGVGSALFDAAERWASERECRELCVETQNVNAGACEFYLARGCELRSVDPHAYPELPGEVKLVFAKRLVPRAPGPR